MNYSAFYWSTELLSEHFQGPGQIFVVLGYWSPVQVLSMIYVKKESLNIYAQQNKHGLSPQIIEHKEDHEI